MLSNIDLNISLLALGIKKIIISSLINKDLLNVDVSYNDVVIIFQKHSIFIIWNDNFLLNKYENTNLQLI